MYKVCVSIVVGLVASSPLLAQDAGDLEIEERAVLMQDGEEFEYEVGTVFVPENRSDPNSRVIGVGFAWLPSSDPDTGAPPIFLLPGGPGFSYVTQLEDASPATRARLIRNYEMYRSVADLVLVDQRGHSGRGDVLRAVFRSPGRDPSRVHTIDDQIAMWKGFAKDTRDHYAETGIDLRGYTVKECADDVADLASALAFPEFTLVGTSFGSQWSFAVMRRHPELVARALLSGVEPLDSAYDMPSYVFAALQRMWWTIEQDEQWQEYLPEGGIAAAAEAVIQRLEREPLALEVAGRTVLVGPLDFPSRDPAQILEMYHGEFSRLRRDAASQSFGPQEVERSILGVLIDSSLGVTPQRGHRLWTDPATRYLGRGNFAGYMATADLWPSPDVGDDFRTPEVCEIPVVFAQGDWDLSTPIENLFEIAPYFPNSRCIVAEQGGHGVLAPIHQEVPDAWEKIDRFLRTGEMDTIPGRVRLRGRSFTAPNFDLEEVR